MSKVILQQRAWSAAYYKRNAQAALAKQTAYSRSPKGRATRQKWRVKNKQRIAHYESRPERKAQRRSADRLKRTGICQQVFDAALLAQKGKCKICRRTLQQTRRGVDYCATDHDHTTGAFRGLLCSRCNAGLGQFRDSPSLLRQAALYIEASV